MIETLLQSLAENADRNAFCIGNRFYSYTELQGHIARIQRQIGEAAKARPGKKIAVVCSNDIGTYASLLAIWFSGCAYVPLGLHNPVDRNLTILEIAEVEIIISSIELDNPAYSSFRIITPGPESDPSDEKLYCMDVQPSSLAYILFTSGSTGLPKGVAITHENLSSFIEAFASSPCRIDKEDRCLQMYELTFDLSISSYLPALLNGACVYTVPNDEVKYMQVMRIITEYKLTSIQIVPSIIKLAKPLLKRINLPAVRNCILGGEATQFDLLTLWRDCIPNAAIYNYYGPTEATIYCSWMEYPTDCRKQYNGMLAIGKALDGSTLLIVDDKDEELPPGEKGELLIAGRQLTPGYVNNEEKNKASFLEKTMAGIKMRFYRSGDMCYKDEDGDIFYCGRFDNQVKIQGFRVELSEIEFLVRGKFEMNNVVTVSENGQGATSLVLVLENEGKEDIRGVLTYLKDKLPEYMIPARVVLIDEFPLNTSGKTDRKKIKEMLNGSP